MHTLLVLNFEQNPKKEPDMTQNDKQPAVPFPTAEEQETYRRLCRERLAPPDMMRELERVISVLAAYRTGMEHELHLGALLRRASLSLQIAMYAAPNEEALQRKKEALRGSLAIDSGLSNIVPMLDAALSCDARRVAPHWSE